MSSSRPEKTRKRAAHTKSGAGCETCKARHVRCDETKPTCLRCQKAGRECGGYDANPSLQRKSHFRAFRPVSFGPPEDHASSSTSASATTPSSTAAARSAGSPANSSVASTPDAQSAVVSSFSDPPLQQQRPQPEPLQLLQSPLSPLSVQPSPFTNDEVLSDGDSFALEFFARQTIPVLRQFGYQTLWSDATAHFIFSTPVLRQIAVALGAQHMQLGNAAAEAQPAAPEGGRQLDVSESYSRALRSLRAMISQVGSSATVVSLSCLLLAIHDSLSLRRNDLLVHLCNALRIIGERSDLDASDIGAELRTTVRRLGLSAMLRKPDGTAFTLLSNTRHLLTNADQPSKLDRIRSAVDDIATTTIGFASSIAWDVFPNDMVAGQKRDQLRERLAAVESELSAYDAAHPSPSSFDAILRPSIEARAVLTSIILSAVMSRYQTAYDAHLGSFRRIVDLSRRSISAMRRDFTGPDDNTRLFVLDLGVVPALGYTAGLCRDARLRRECLDLLRLGPCRDGAWDAHSTWVVHKLKMELEERLAGAFDPDGYSSAIPEGCRILFTDLVEGCEDNGFRRQMTVQWKPRANSNEFMSQMFYIE